MWFKTLTGFEEKTAAQVQANLTVAGQVMTSSVNQRKMTCGRLATPSLAELRKSAGRDAAKLKGQLTIDEVVGDVQELHCQARNAGALFQVASQFNLLEMASPSATPELGVDIYENDRTQGPACAIACGAGTIYRNYFAEVNGKTGQTAANQIDCLADLGVELGNGPASLWSMQNGYALASAAGLKTISARLAASDEVQRDALREKLRIGVHWSTEVTLNNAGHHVSQAYCSAMPVAYSGVAANLWEDFARLTLEAAYEATLAAAISNAVNTNNNKLFLTLLGGGVFGNPESWILAAIDRALRRYKNVGLDVSIVSYRTSKPQVKQFADNW